MLGNHKTVSMGERKIARRNEVFRIWVLTWSKEGELRGGVVKV